MNITIVCSTSKLSAKTSRDMVHRSEKDIPNESSPNHSFDNFTHFLATIHFNRLRFVTQFKGKLNKKNLISSISHKLYNTPVKQKIGKFMSRPVIKFLSHFASYLCFIVMIVVDYLQYDYEDKVYLKFSSLLPNYTKILNNYSKRNDLTYNLDFTDFVIRDSQPTQLDIVISIWVLGQVNILILKWVMSIYT